MHPCRPQRSRYRFAFPKEWHTPRIPGFGEIDWAKFMAKLREIGYSGPVCIEVEDDTFGKSLEGRKSALQVARNVLKLPILQLYDEIHLPGIGGNDRPFPSAPHSDGQGARGRLPARRQIPRGLEVCIKPYFVKRAAQLLSGTGVKVGAVIGFPHTGNKCHLNPSATKPSLPAKKTAPLKSTWLSISAKALGGDWDFVEPRYSCSLQRRRTNTARKLR